MIIRNKIKTLSFLKSKKTFGFTLIEALIAISILMVAIAGPLTMTQRSLASSMFSRDQMVATFLAQDAMEGVKNIRDQIAINAVSGVVTDWLGILSDCLCSGTNCNFDNDPKTACSIDTALIGTAGETYVKPFNASDYMRAIFEDNNFIRFSIDNTTGVVTKFKRMINIQKNPNGDNPDEAKVQVRVSWRASSGEKKVDLVYYIYNYEQFLQ